jgi:hypothetical protein
MPLSTLRRVGVPVALGDVDRPEVDGLRPDVPAHAGRHVRWLAAPLGHSGTLAHTASTPLQSHAMVLVAAQHRMAVRSPTHNSLQCCRALSASRCAARLQRCDRLLRPRVGIIACQRKGGPVAQSLAIRYSMSEWPTGECAPS